MFQVLLVVINREPFAITAITDWLREESVLLYMSLSDSVCFPRLSVTDTDVMNDWVIVHRSVFPLQWTAAGRRGRSGQCAAVAVGGAIRRGHAAAPIPRLWMEEPSVRVKPSRNWPVTRSVQVPHRWCQSAGRWPITLI